MSESATTNVGTNATLDPSVDDLAGKDPWSDDTLRSLILLKRSNSKAKRQKLARDWFRSELFYNGVQWITFDKGLKRWREIGLKKSTPTPVTNMFASYCDVFSSLLASVPIEVTYRPLNSNSTIDRIKMETANDLTEAIKETVDLSKQQRSAAPKIIRQGEVFLIPKLVLDGNTVEEPAQEQNPAMEGIVVPPELQGMFSIMGGVEEPPALPPLGQGLGGLLGPLFNKGNASQYPDQGNSQEENMTPVTESPGQEMMNFEQMNPEPQTPQIPKLVVEVASTFECYMDEESDSMEESSFFLRERSYDVGKLKERYSNFADKIAPSQQISGDISRYYAGSLTRLTSGEFGNSGYFISDGTRGNNRANLIEFWLDPCKNYPEGIYALVVNDNVVVHKGPLPYHDEEGKKFKNVIQIRAKQRTKNCHGRTPMDDAIPKQIQRNKLESFIELAIYRMASPHWLLPKDCGVSALSGEPGTSIFYNRVSASQNSVLKPEMIAGVAPHPIVVDWLRQIDRDTQSLLGITEALLGEIPSGLPAARALEMAMQRSKERHGDIFFEWSSKWADCLNMLLKIVKQTKPVDLYHTVKEDCGGFKLRVFEEGDYDLNLNIIAETQQPAPPRSTASEISLIEEFGKMGIFQMPPNVQYELLNRFGLDYLNKSMESDKDYIAREHYFLINDNVEPIVQTFDNHPLHIEDHRIFRQSDKYSEWAKANPQLAQEFDQHIMAHQNMQAQLQAQAAQAQQQAQLQAKGGAQPSQPQLQQPSPVRMAG